MKPLGKAMKICHQNQKNEKECLQHLLRNYRDTPHPATAVPPGAMLFRDGYQTDFPGVGISEEDVKLARNRDQTLKDNRQEKINCSKYQKTSNLKIDDTVVMRDSERKSKFDPIFPLDPYKVVAIQGTTITICRDRDDKIFRRHPDDLKKTRFVTSPLQSKTAMTEREQLMMFHQRFNDVQLEDDGDFLQLFTNTTSAGTTEIEVRSPEPVLRRSSRERHANPRYFNMDMDNL